MIKRNMIILFTSKICMACETAKEIYRPMFGAEEMYQEIDIDREMDLTDALSVQSIPTLIFIKDGVEFDRIIGAPRYGFAKRMYDDFIQEIKTE